MRAPLIATLLAGCIGAPGDHDAEPEEQQGAILNGTPFGSDRDAYIQNIYTCDGKHVNSCSGTLVAPGWVLTAAHCEVICSEQQRPHHMTVTVNGQSSTVDSVVNHFSLDYALLKLTTPLASPSFKSFLYTHTSESLFNVNATIEGWAGNDCANDNFGVLRYGTMWAAIFPDQYNITWVPRTNQTAVSGDSGAPFFRNFRGIYYQVGVEKSGDCGTDDAAGRPENFEQWVFEVIYNAPIHVPTTDASGRGLWFLANLGADSAFWSRPLANNKTLETPADYQPCNGRPGTYRVDYNVDFEIYHDYLDLFTSSSSTSITGSLAGIFYGTNSFALQYRTDGAGPSQGVSSMTIQCGYNAGDPGDLVCHGSRCGTTRMPLQDNWTRTVSWDPCVGAGFKYYLDYDVETNYDHVTIAGHSYTGAGSANGVHLSGPTTLTVQTDGSVQSKGIRSLRAVCDGW